MTEFQLKSYTRAASYGLATLFVFFLAIQNYRYGFYELVYTATLLIPLLILGVAYTFAQRYINAKDTAHQLLLGLMVILIALNITAPSTNATHWIYPFGLLSYLILPFKGANQFNGAVLFFVSIIVLSVQGIYNGLLFFTSYLLISGMAGIFAYLHHHKSRSLVELSLHDALTGAYNMKHLDDTLTKEISRTNVTGHGLSLIALRIDYFDQFADLHGHNAANELVVALSNMLGSMIRAGDSHYFSEQSLFYLLLPNTPQEGVLVMAERVRRTVEESSWPMIGAMSISLGCTTSSGDASTAAILREEVDNALRDAEVNGHNRVNHHKQ